MNKIIKILSLFLVVITVLTASVLPALALSWDGSATGGNGGGTAAGANGYAVRYTDVNTNLLGYRFSVVDKTGANKVSKVIDVFRNTTYGNSECDNAYKFATKYNKKQIINNQNSSYSTSKNSTNCYKEANMGFATSLPTTSGMATWQNNATNLNKVLSTLGVGSISNLKNGDKVLVEPIFDVRLQSVYHALTVSEIAIYGKYILGASSNGGASSTAASWGFISDYTNKRYPNALFTPDGKGLWTGVSSASSSRITFYNIINNGYGAGIAYTETKSDFSPNLNVQKCEAWPGAISTRNSNHFGISTGNAFSNWEYGHGYPVNGSDVWFAVNFPKESENCYVKQTVWIDGGGSTSRNVWLNDNQWYDVKLSPSTVDAGRDHYTVKARMDWIDSSGKVLKNGTEKSFYIPIRPTLSRYRVTAYSVTGKAQAYTGEGGSSGSVYVGQRVTIQYKFTSSNTWTSYHYLRSRLYERKNGEWVTAYTNATYGNADLYEDNVSISKTSDIIKNGKIGTYTVPDNNDGQSNRMRFNVWTHWASDIDRTTEANWFDIPILKSDVELYDIVLVNKDGDIVNQNELEVDEELTIHYIYKNNTDCTVYVNGYNSKQEKITGTFEIPARGSIEVVGNSFIVPNKRDFSVWGGVYLEGVAKGHTAYETNGNNNAWSLNCHSKHPVKIVPITPNAAYREKTKVFSSFTLRNISSDDYTPDKIKVQFTAKDKNNNQLYTETKDVIVPKKDTNFVYFSFSVPMGLNSEYVTVSAEIIEDSKRYNNVERQRDVIPYTYYVTPETSYEKKAPSSFDGIPETQESSSEYATWSEYRYENGKFVKHTYGIGIYLGGYHELTSQTDPSHNEIEIKSGYGIQVSSTNCMTGVNNTESASYGTMYTMCQYAYAALPEYNYELGEGKCKTLTSGRKNQYSQWIFPTTGKAENTHYTPVWYPDGMYQVIVHESDAWTPNGMITANNVPNILTVNGNMYDDYYVGRH